MDIFNILFVKIDWKNKFNIVIVLVDELDLMKYGVCWEKGMIVFNSIVLDEKLFDVENFKRVFFICMFIEGDIVLNYGYVKGYRLLMNYLFYYMEMKGVDILNKDILIINGFIEGLDIVFFFLLKKFGCVICENLIYYVVFKFFCLYGFEVYGIDMYEDGIDMNVVEKSLCEKDFEFVYLIFFYYNLIGIVMSLEKRMELMRLFLKYNVFIIEDGFNEELCYLGLYLVLLLIFVGVGNNVIYISSFLKVFFFGLCVGWIIVDKELIYYLESVKRVRMIYIFMLD